MNNNSAYYNNRKVKTLRIECLSMYFFHSISIFSKIDTTKLI